MLAMVSDVLEYKREYFQAARLFFINIIPERKLVFSVW